MDKSLLLDVQRKVIGTYINAEEFSINGSHVEILSTELSESLFDNVLHKAIVRACNKLKADNIPISDYTVLDFLQKYKMPKNNEQQSEYLILMTQHSITVKTFKHYISMILNHKLEN